MPIDPTGRRPLKTRGWPFFQKLAAWLARSGVTPNAISFASIVFSVMAGAALAATSLSEGWAVRLYFLAAAGFIQLRLIANLLDGMVAVEGGKGGPTGDLWNEAPDRISDAATLIGAGYAAGGDPLLGYAATLIAIFVAYVRALGASVGAGQIFLGPMAKPHRMAAMTVTCLVAMMLPGSRLIHVTPDIYIISHHSISLVSLALFVIIVGGVITSIRRLRRIAAFLRGKAGT